VHDPDQSRSDNRGADFSDRSCGATRPQPIYAFRLAITDFARARIF
jgi:hypothetical protein